MKKEKKYSGCKTFFNSKKFKIAGSIVGVAAISITAGIIINLSNSNSSIDEVHSSSESSKETEAVVTITSEVSLPITSSNEEIVISTAETEKITQATSEITTPKETQTATFQTTTQVHTAEKPVQVTTTKVPQTEIIITETEEPEITNSNEVQLPDYYNQDFFTKESINDYDVFDVAFWYFYASTSNIGGYIVPYNEVNNAYEMVYSDAIYEKKLFVYLLNTEYMSKEMFNKILGNYSKEQLVGLSYSMVSVFATDLVNNRNYNFSNIVIDKDLATLLTDLTTYYYNGNTAKVSQLCNENYGKYNSLVDTLLISFVYECIKAYNVKLTLPSEETIYDLAEKAINEISPKVLVR